MYHVSISRKPVKYWQTVGIKGPHVTYVSFAFHLRQSLDNVTVHVDLVAKHLRGYPIVLSS